MYSKTTLSAPWFVFFRKIEALLAKDPEVKVVLDENTIVIKIFVSNMDKAEALTELLPSEKAFGNVIVTINVYPTNVSSNRVGLYKRAFAGNPVFSSAVETKFPQRTFVVFRPEVVQFFADDFGDLHGVCSTLYQDIARDVFGEEDGVFFCTDLIDGDPDYDPVYD